MMSRDELRFRTVERGEARRYYFLLKMASHDRRAGAFGNQFQNVQRFSSSFDQRFSYPGLAAATTVGDMYGTALFSWAGVPNALGNITTLPGFIIRANSFALGKAAGGAAHAAVKSSANK